MKNTKARRVIKYRRRLAFALAFTMLSSLLSGSVFVNASPSEYLCGHVHDSSCGFVEGSAGSPCTHTHDELCGYVEAAPCTYVHTHDELCGYCEGSACTYTHTHNELCGFNAETGEGCTDVHSHDGTCGYMEAAPCTDVHVHDEACGYVEGAPCLHVHDEKCGYKDPVTAVSCNHVCNILSFNGYINGTALETCEAPAGSSYASICAALPATLEASLSCADGTVDVPVTWSCADFTGAAGIYTFRAALNAAHCVYTASDDPATVDIDESALPFITVTLPEAPPTPETSPEPTTEPSPIPMLPTTLTEGAVTLTGELPEGAYLVVTEVPIADAEELLGETETNTVVLFAYDIKIMLPGALDEATGERGEPAEYQPGAENPVTVAISPPKPIEAPTVEVVHIAENADTGEKTPQSVATVTPTGNTVAFEAEGFSVYVITVVNSEPVTHTVRFNTGDYKVEYSTAEAGPYKLLSAATISLGTANANGEKYNTLYFKVTANPGYTLTGVSSSQGLLTELINCYSLDVSASTAATAEIEITVTGVKITGKPARGQTLTTAFSDDLEGQTFTYAWQSCDSAGEDVQEITGATEASFQLPNDATYDGKYIQVVATDDASNSYTSAPIGPVTENAVMSFDLSRGSVYIGESGIYSGFNSEGEPVTGTHVHGNKYLVMQSESAVTENRIILTGNETKPTYDLTIRDINCAAPSNMSAGGIYADALANAPMTIILNLEGANSVGRVHYATGASNSSSSSSLTIKSTSGGSLTAYSRDIWSAAIGGIDGTAQEASRNIRIEGGTIIAETRGDDSGYGTSAIGGGGNGYSDVTITGGSVTAISAGTGATIGGGGGQTSSGGGGYVYIYGGSVTVTNNTAAGNGVAIGGGGSISSTGSAAAVTITGGTVTVTEGSIGGGRSTTAGGGNATVNISGGRVTVEDGNIGGGSGSTGGTATVNISGGTVVTPHISGGENSDGTFRDATLSIAAASVNIADRSNINSVTGPDPDGGMHIVVYCQTIDVKELDGFTGGSGNITIQSADLSDGHSYSLTDVYSDSDGMLYFWLPTEYRVTGLKIGNTDYTVTDNAQTQVATITHDSSTVGSTLGAALNYGKPTVYKWQISDNGIDNWTDIATSATYIVSSADVDKYIRVVISVNSQDVISGSLHITNTPYARVVYTSLTAGSTLTAQLLNGIPSAYRWQRYDSANKIWADISGAVNPTYQVPDADVGKQLRVIISVGTTNYTSSFVFIYSPSFTITIPESINAAAAGSFSIAGVLSHFASSQSVTVSYSSGNELALTGAETNTLSYSLRTQGDTYIPSGGTVATFSGDGSSTVPIYYTISGIPIYSGTYTDTLTFTVTFNSFITGS